LKGHARLTSGGHVFGTKTTLRAYYRHIHSREEYYQKGGTVFLILGLLLSLSACSQVPIVAPEATVAAPSETFTPYVAGTEAALASPTP
jgi:hypothetical protein